MDSLETAWLAGLIEGEGSIEVSPSLRVAIGMKDRDIIFKVAVLLGLAPVRSHTPLGAPFWRVVVGGARAMRLLDEIRSWMGERRTAKIEEALRTWGPRMDRGEMVGPRKLKPQHVILIRGLSQRGVSQQALSLAAGVSQSAISDLLLRKTWRSVI